MAKDPYSVLGVGRQASAEEIRKAYRKLAKQYHPDRNQGNARAEDQFKAVNAAFEIVGDPEKRKRFDRGQIDADGNERAFARSGPYGGHPSGGAAYGRRPGPQGGGGQQGGFDEFGDIFAEFFGSRGGPSGGRGRPHPQKGRDIRYRLTVDFLEAARGVTKRVALPDGRGIDIAVPAGLRDGQTLRLKGQGSEGQGGGGRGDVLVDVSVRPHAVFRPEGDNLTMDVPITLAEAVRGGRIEIPTLAGPVTIKLPPNTSSGKSFRLKEKGLPNPKTGTTGDLYARMKIVLPEAPDPALSAFIEKWRGDDSDPRADLLAKSG